MPTYSWQPRFGRDLRALTRPQQAAFLAVVALMVEDLGSGKRFRPGLRIKAVRGSPGVLEMSWAPDGRATFEFGAPLKEGVPHIIWRRVGTHDVFKDA